MTRSPGPTSIRPDQPRRGGPVRGGANVEPPIGAVHGGALKILMVLASLHFFASFQFKTLGLLLIISDKTLGLLLIISDPKESKLGPKLLERVANLVHNI